MVKRLATFVAVSLAAAGLTASSASAELPWLPCGDNIDYACARLTVPLDRSGVVPGTVGLALRRRRATVGDERVAVVALAGGPGQESVTMASAFASLIAPAIGTRDLIVFDQRGIGYSGAIGCRALPRIADPDDPPPSVATTCGNQLGPRRNHYATLDTVADIEAIRQAAGYDRLLLYGTSYGTKTALDYARLYPTRVEGLLLDSPVPPDGLDPFDRPTYRAIGQIMGGLCGGGLCAGITHSPQADLTRLVRRATARQLHGVAFDGRGVGRRVSISARNLVDIIGAGDFDPTLRADLPGAIRAALTGDTGPLARLRDRAISASPVGGANFAASSLATLCVDVAYPWDRAAPPADRFRQAIAAARALPASAFAPFDASLALSTGSARLCSGWPYDPGSAPPRLGPLPAVPTLILSGAEDVRTPTANARAIAAQIPGAQVVVVPGVGHSVLGTDFGSCAIDAVAAFTRGRPAQSCRGIQGLTLRPSPLPPRSLAQLRPAGGVRGNAGRTVAAVRATVDDLARRIVAEGLFAGSQRFVARFGGLRGGWARLSPSGVKLHGYSYVPGVNLTGAFLRSGDRLQVGGRAAATGTLVANGRGRLNGRLGARHVHFGYAVVTARTARVPLRP